MNTKDKKNWKEIKAEQEMTRRLQSEHPWHAIPSVYSNTFHLYLRWVLASIPLPKSEAEIPPPLHDTYSLDYQKLREHFKRNPVSISDVGAFLEEVLGEQFEEAFGQQADANDYEYVADTLREETRNLPSVPHPVERAYKWLDEKAAALAKQVDNPTKEGESSLRNEPTGTASPDDVTEASKLAALSTRQIALLYIYEEKLFDAGTVKQILHQVGRTAPSSVRQFMEKYNGLALASSRKNASGRVLADLIKDIEKTIPHLSAVGKLRAEEELHLMNANKENGI